MIDRLCSVATLNQAWDMVKAKGTSGGLDGVGIEDFQRQLHKELASLSAELRSGRWYPVPYLEVEVAKTKHPDESRRLGMLSVRDKVVQHALKLCIEPRMERLFVGNSYGYRPGKGALKAIRRLRAECTDKRYQYVLRLDIDNFFDSMDFDILRQRLSAIGLEPEIIRLIMLCVQMGRVRQFSMKWVDADIGVPQGAVISPLLSNLYLHSFDQFAVSRGVPYIRYADDFLFLCHSQQQAEDILRRTKDYLFSKLKLKLNEPAQIEPLSSSFEFLGIAMSGCQPTLTDAKRQELCRRISSLEIDANGLSARSKKSWDGICNYYAKLLPQDILSDFDNALVQCLIGAVERGSFPSKSSISSVMASLPYLSETFRKEKKQHDEDVLGHFFMLKNRSLQKDADDKNRKIIQQRKKEFRSQEVAASGLLVNKPGTFVGLTNRGITLSHKGKVLAYHQSENLSQIVITGAGVSLSSNIISFCTSRNIPIDFFDAQGTHLGSVITAKNIQGSHWAEQAAAPTVVRNNIAGLVIDGKLRNQLALLKYFHKYHKSRIPMLDGKMEAMDNAIKTFRQWRRTCPPSGEDFVAELRGYEGAAAVCYWDYIRMLMSDDDVAFENREHRGATDLFNSMLNYGYAILYARVWQALLAAQLNPFDGLVHSHQSGKPALVYDMVELFRCQVVDRVAISLVQKGQELEVRNGLLTDDTRQLLVKSIMERLARYEKCRGREMTMEQIMASQARDLAQAFCGTKRFKPYVAKW